jgi:hypothetical protein
MIGPRLSNARMAGHALRVFSACPLTNGVPYTTHIKERNGLPPSKELSSINKQTSLPMNLL